MDRGVIMTEVAKIGVEFWKLIKSYERSVVLLPPDHQAKSKAQIRFSLNRLKTLLDDAGMSLVTFEGRPFEPNLPVTALNSDDYPDENETLVIDQTIEPTILHESDVLLIGKVMLARGRKHVSGN